MRQFSWVRQLSAVLSLAIVAATLGVTAGLSEQSSRTLRKLTESVGHETWLIRLPERGGTIEPLPKSVLDGGLRQTIPEIASVALATRAVRSAMKFGYLTAGVSSEFYQIRRYELAAGNYPRAPDEAVAGYDLKHLMLQNVQAFGRNVTVVGYLASVAGRGGPDWAADFTLYVPLESAPVPPTELFIQAKPSQATPIADQLRSWLLQNGLKSYEVLPLISLYGLQLRQQVARLLSGALGFGVLAVLLAAIANLLAFFAVRVLERMRMIGIRRATGATIQQVVFEEIADSLPWAILGLVTGLPAASLAAWWLEKTIGVNAYPGALATLIVFCTLTLLVSLTSGLVSLRTALQQPAYVIKSMISSIATQRAWLIGAGIALGAAGFVLQVSTAESAERETSRLIGTFQDRLGIFSSFRFSNRAQFLDPRGTPQLTLSDYLALQSAAPAKRLHAMGFVERGFLQIQAPNLSRVAAVSAFKDGFLQLSTPELVTGRFPRHGQVLLGLRLANQIFGSANPVDEAISLGGRSFIVSGVYKGGDDFAPGNLPNDHVVVSLDDIQHIPGSRGEILIQVGDEYDFGETLEEVAAFLTARHNDPTLAPVAAHTLQDVFPPIRAALRELSAVYQILSAMLLLLGGVGLAAQMFVSITSRAREIAIRRAVGASQSAVFGLFFTQGTRLALYAASIGGLFGIALSFLASALQKVSPAIKWSSPLFAIGVAMVVAVLFSAWPAWAASRAEPAQSLRGDMG